MKLTAQQWTPVLKACAVGAAALSLWPTILAEQLDGNKFSKGPTEVPHFMANVLHESNRLAAMVESLKYSAERIHEMAVANGPNSRFAKADGMIQRGELKPYDDVALAEVLYGGRYGNVRPGDGFLYRGRSPIGLTFFDNYDETGDLVGQDLVGLPNLAEMPRFGLDITFAWWEDKVPDKLVGNIGLVRRVVNGGNNGLADVQKLTAILVDQLRPYA